jgi:hypothetical protein
VRVPRWVVGLVILWICTISAVSGAGWRHQEHTNRELERQNAALSAEIDERREAGCVSSNDTRDLIRRMSRDAPLEVGEAIIEVSTAQDDGTPPDPAVIDQFRAAMARRLEGIVNQLPARRWDPDTGTCVDVPLDTGG